MGSTWTSVGLRGFMRDGNLTQPEGLRLPDFKIDIANRQATCPARPVAMRWSAISKNVKNNLACLVSFGKQCQDCPFFGPDLCTAKPAGRPLAISRHHNLISTRRVESKIQTFHQEMHQRAAIEGTLSELVRAHATRRSCYPGLPKNQWQANFTAAVTTLKRLARALASLAKRPVIALFSSFSFPLFPAIPVFQQYLVKARRVR